MPPEILIRTTTLSKNFRAGGDVVHAVQQVSLSVKRGEFIAIVGRSGSGKSTLMSLLGFLERADSGQYIFDGRPAHGMSDDELALVRRQKVGFIFQLPALLPRVSAQANVALPLLYAGLSSKECRIRSAEALKRVGLSHRAKHSSDQLSGGEQQRVAIARALVNNPILIIADEPTGALDSVTSAEILSLLVDLHRDGRTILLVTHASEVAEQAQRVITIHDGKIVKDLALV